MCRRLKDNHAGQAGAKTTVWEGGHRVVGIARWLGGIVNPGRRSDALAQTVDFLPTFAAIAGIALPADRTFDGVDLSGVLLNTTTQGHVTMFHAHDGGDAPAAMRWENYKAHFKLTGAGPCCCSSNSCAAGVDCHWDGTKGPNVTLPLIFDLHADPAEAHALDHATIPAVLAKINAEYASFQASVQSDKLQSHTNYSKSFDHRPCGNNTAGNTCCRKAGPTFPPSHGVVTATAAAATTSDPA